MFSVFLPFTPTLSARYWTFLSEQNSELISSYSHVLHPSESFQFFHPSMICWELHSFRLLKIQFILSISSYPFCPQDTLSSVFINTTITTEFTVYFTEDFGHVCSTNIIYSAGVSRQHGSNWLLIRSFKYFLSVPSVIHRDICHIS
jgi:hypothetical protein